MEELTRLYEDYLSQVRKAAAGMRPGDGLFGMGRKLSDDICHDLFVNALEEYLNREKNAAPERIYQILQFIYRAPIAYPEAHSSAYWMMLSVHKLTLGLIPSLLKADTKELLIWYQTLYPKAQRLIAQIQVIQALKKRSQTSVFLP